MEEIRDDAALTTKRARKAIAATDRLLKEGPSYGPNEGIAQAWLYVAAAVASVAEPSKDQSSAQEEIKAQIEVIMGPETESSDHQAENEVLVAREEPPSAAAAATIPPAVPTSPSAPAFIPPSTEEEPSSFVPVSVAPVLSEPHSPTPPPDITVTLPSPPVSPAQSISSPVPTITSSPSPTTPPTTSLPSSVPMPSPIVLEVSPSSTSPTPTPSLPITDLSHLFPPSPSTFISSKPRKKTLASKTKAPSKTQTRAPPAIQPPSIPKPTTTTRLSNYTTMRQSLDYLINRHIVFEQEIYRQLETLRQQQQNSYSQLLAAIQHLQNHPHSHSSPVTCPTSSPIQSPFHEPFSTPISSTSSPFVILIPDTSSPPTSVIPTPPTSVIPPTPSTYVIPPTPPTSLVSPLSSPSTSLPTPIPFHLPITYASITQQQANLARSPFLGILPGVSNPIFLAPQPLQAQYPDPLQSPDPVLPLPSIPPFTVPSPSHVPMPTSLTFTLRQISAPFPSSEPIFSTFPTTTTPSSSDHAS